MRNSTINLIYLSEVFIKISIEDGVWADWAHGNQVATDEDDQHVAGGGGGVKLERSIIRLRGVKLVELCFRMFSRKLFIKYKLGWAEPHSRFPLSFPLISLPLRTHKSWSTEWLLRYSSFNILRSSPIGGCLPLEVIFIWMIKKTWFGHISLSLKFEYDPISGRWDIPLLTFWGLQKH